MFKRVVFVFNPKSGSSFRIVEDLKKIRNIFSQNYAGIECKECSLLSGELSELIEQYKNEKCLFVACGGDGSVVSVAEKIYKNPLFYLSVLPYGTGNDFSRAIGLFKSSDDLYKITKLLVGENIVTIEFDMWSIENKIFLNYLSLGFDAAIVDRFQRLRGYLPALFKRPIVNRVLYLISSVFHLFYSIPSGTMIKYRDQEINLSGIKTLIVGNINSYAGGKPLARNVNCTDGQLNVFSLKNLGSVVRLVVGKGINKTDEKSNSIILNLNSKLICQIDGEPHPLAEGTHRISLIGKIKVIGA